MKKKPKDKNKSAESKISAEQDIVGLITTLVERLVAVETKMDTVLKIISSKSYELPKPQSFQAPAPRPHMDTRPMFKAVCAECSKECEIPFRPSNNRPVYCKDCWAKRKNAGAPVVRQEARPVERHHGEKPRMDRSAEPFYKNKFIAKKGKHKPDKRKRR